eukprot:snap_masked-scaffold336_size202805-processed-gene-0.11 protein:Tk02905 transcript:snap_masked-scaffold336_size202805-processed-gene-0.11-mRNA-1 annotation:"phd finger protein 20-like isoform x2"
MEASAPPTNGTASNTHTTTVQAAEGEEGALESESAHQAGPGDGVAPTETPPTPGGRKRARKSGATPGPHNGNPSGSATTGGGSGRRERKQKFDVKQLLNLRGPAGAVVSPSASRAPSRRSSSSETSGGVSAPGTPVAVDMTGDTISKTRRSSRVKSNEAHATPNKAPTTNGNEGPPNTPISTRNSKEPLLKEANTAVMITGKRERKRKKFWDERDNSPTTPTPPAKVIKKAETRPPSGGSTPIPPIKASHSKSKKDRRERKVSGVSLNSAAPSQIPPDPEDSNGTAGAKEESTPLAPENGKSLPYLTFDLSAEPELIAKQMVEGVNIPGPGVAIPVDSSTLPQGWHKRVIQREIGVTKGKWDVYIQSPFGKSFRSKIELQKFFDEKKMDLRSDIFDFSLDNVLKRLRQIWKQYIVVPKARNSEEAVKNRKLSSHLSQPGESGASQDANPVVNVKHGQDKENEASKVEGPPTEGGTIPRLAVESETGQGLRCSVDKCSKLFRNGRLLHQHIKHYHPKVYQQSLTASKSTRASHSPKPDETDHLLPEFHSKRLIETRRRKTSLGEPFLPSMSSPKVSPGLERKLQTSFSLPECEETPPPPNKILKKSLCKNKSQRKTSLVLTDDDEVFFNPNPRASRTRNDSILSVGSEASASVLGEDAATPPIKPTFRVSKRRQAQLNKKSAALKAAKRDEESLDSRPGLMTASSEELAHSLLFGAGRPEGEGVPGISSGCPSVSYPPSEMDASVISEHLTNEEVVNCTCKRTEEDGLMIQCDICLCWQHGICLGIDEEDQVPDKHVCQICRDPPNGRRGSRFAFDQDWLKEGKLSRILLADGFDPDSPGSSSRCPFQPTQSADETAFKKLSELMADLANLSKVLHSLRVKLFVASQRSNSKVFMWSSPWHGPDAILVDPMAHLLPEHNVPSSTAGPMDLGAIANGQALLDSHHSSSVTSNVLTDSNPLPGQMIGIPNGTKECTLSPHGVTNTENDPTGPQSNGCAATTTSSNTVLHSLTTQELSEKIQSIDGVSMEPSESGADEDQASILNHAINPSHHSSGLKDKAMSDSTNSPPIVTTESVEDLSKHLENGMDIDPNLIPSVSEVQRLLPSIIQATLAAQLDGGVGDDHSNPGGTAFDCLGGVPPVVPATVPPAPLPNPIYFPQQKRIDRDESRANLLDHIEQMQNDLSEVLDKVEEHLLVLERAKQGCQVPSVAETAINQLVNERNKLYIQAKNVTIMMRQDLSSARKLIKAV